MAENIVPISIVEETRHRYLNYALSVIQSRALPDVRDGLKPVQRRILYTMYNDLHLYADSKPRKCAKIVGDVTGNYHPHGTAAAYEALVHLAQDFVMRMPLVNGQGNFGSVDGDPPAAERYTEAKLHAIAEPLMAELRQRTVDMRANYDGTRDEPTVVPAQFPNLLVNGSAGIAVGMATNIPPHNLGEVCDACAVLIDDPEATTATLMKKIKGPDFPLGGKVLVDTKSLRQIYEDGSGTIKIQSEWKLEEHGKKQQIIVTSIPHGVNKGNLEGAIGEIIESRKLPGLLNLSNESNEKDGIRIALEIKSGSDPQMIMTYLLKHTSLQENYSYNLTCLVPGADGKPRPERIGLKAILRYFLDFRFATVKRRFEFELEQLKKRIHILEGFRIVFDALDKAIKIIRESDGKQDAAEKLMKTFKLDEIQTEAILDVQLYKIAQLEIKKILEELRDKKAEAARIEGILRSDKKLWSVIKDELGELRTKFGDKRRTRMGSAEDLPEFNEEMYIQRENTNVVLTRDGWIKRVGRLASVEGTRVREGDAVVAVVPGSTLDHVILLSDDGAAYTIRINEVPASSGYGEPVAKFFRLADQARIIAAVSTDPRFLPPPVEGQEGPLLLVATAQGQTLRLPLTPFREESTKVGRRYVKLNEGDKVVLATMQKDERSIFLASKDGHVIHFPIEEINILSGVGKGVMGIKLEDGDLCLGGALIRNQNDALVVETSGGKTMEFFGSRELTARGGKGFEAVKRTSFERIVPPAIALVNWEELEGKPGDKNGKTANGDGKTLFE